METNRKSGYTSLKFANLDNLSTEFFNHNLSSYKKWHKIQLLSNYEKKPCVQLRARLLSWSLVISEYFCYNCYYYAQSQERTRPLGSRR